MSGLSFSDLLAGLASTPASLDGQYEEALDDDGQDEAEDVRPLHMRDIAQVVMNSDYDYLTMTAMTLTASMIITLPRP